MRTYFYIVSRMDQREGSAGGGIARRGFMLIVRLLPPRAFASFLFHSLSSSTVACCPSLFVPRCSPTRVASLACALTLRLQTRSPPRMATRSGSRSCRWNAAPSFSEYFTSTFAP